MQALPGGGVEANVSRPPSLSAGVAVEPQRHPRHAQRRERRMGASRGDGASQGSSGHRDQARMVVPLIYGSARLNFPSPADRHGGSHVWCCAHWRHQAHRDGPSGARFCSARSAAQTNEALRRRRGARGRQSGWALKCQRRICRESVLRASSPLCRHRSRGDGGVWHAEPSTHPLPSKAEIRLSRFVASARHPWNAAALHLLPARRNQAALGPRSKLGGFNAQFAVSTAYQTQLQLLSLSHEVILKGS